MKCSARITVEEDSDNLIKLFEPETKEFENKRAFYSISRKGGKTEFVISAQDSTALRAVLNSIAKNLIIHEKVKNGQEN